VPTSGGGSTAAATYSFFSADYKAPRQGRSTAQDIVHNQNGIFKYRYDNGPNVHAWSPFRVVISERFKGQLGAATQQWANLSFLWNYSEGPLKLQAPEGIYNVDWSDAPLERQFMRYPAAAGDKEEWDIEVQVTFEEG
jgi:hypothetical protein